MKNGQACCILGVCCGRASQEQRAALAKFLQEGTGCNEFESREMADFIVENFDLAPAGSLDAFKQGIKTAIKHAAKAEGV